MFRRLLHGADVRRGTRRASKEIELENDPVLMFLAWVHVPAKNSGGSRGLSRKTLDAGGPEQGGQEQTSFGYAGISDGLALPQRSLSRTLKHDTAQISITLIPYRPTSCP